MLTLLEVLARSGTVQLNPPTSFTASVGGASQVNLAWTRASAGYVTEVWRNGSLYFTTAAGAQTYNDTGATSGFAFTYQIRHKSGASYSSFTVILTQSGTPPAPSISTSVSTDDVTVNWSSVASATSYNVYRDGSLVGSTGGTSYNDNNLANGTYAYTVKATNGTNLSAASNTSNATVAYTAPLTDPSSLSLTSPYADRVGISWTNGDVTASTEIYRGTSPNPTSLLTTVAAAGTSYTDTGRAVGTLYYYRIRHVKGAQTSNYVESSITTPVPAFTGITLALTNPLDPTSAIQLAWSVSNPFFSTRVDIDAWMDTEAYASGAGASYASSPYVFDGVEYTLGGSTTIGFSVAAVYLRNGLTGTIVDTIAPSTSFKATGVVA